jgi:hypothetical protein
MKIERTFEVKGKTEEMIAAVNCIITKENIERGDLGWIWLNAFLVITEDLYQSGVVMRGVRHYVARDGESLVGTDDMAYESIKFQYERYNELFDMMDYRIKKIVVPQKNFCLPRKLPSSIEIHTVTGLEKIAKARNTLEHYAKKGYLGMIKAYKEGYHGERIKDAEIFYYSAFDSMLRITCNEEAGGDITKLMERVSPLVNMNGIKLIQEKNDDLSVVPNVTKTEKKKPKLSNSYIKDFLKQ